MCDAYRASRGEPGHAGAASSAANRARSVETGTSASDAAPDVSAPSLTIAEKLGIKEESGITIPVPGFVGPR